MSIIESTGADNWYMSIIGRLRYRPAHTYPTEDISRQLKDTLISFKSQLTNHSNELYTLLQPNPSQTQIPKFYGIPKMHKQYTTIPLMRPIVAHTNSLLNPTAKFLDHLLQPIARAYSDYLHNSASLSLLLETLVVPDSAILVSVDVDSLYPSIPQTECLNIIYDELHSQRHLLLFDPNLVIRLLHINVNFNYFEFSTYIFQQVTGTAMGAAFSPALANIFMSVVLRRFLRTQIHHPLLLKRYIDDIFIVWTESRQQLETFLTELNEFHPSLHFTYSLSVKSTDFLDLTIYKGPHFQCTQHLDTKTFKNLKIYISTCILNPAMKKVFTNTRVVHQFKARLQARNYPPEFVNKTTALISYDNRDKYLQQFQPARIKMWPPLFKCIPPPQFQKLKQVILQDYSLVQSHAPHPRFIPLRHKTLGQALVRAQIRPTDDQLLDLAITFDTPTSKHVTAGSLPELKVTGRLVKKCGHPKCATCQHLQCQSSFKSTKTKRHYPIRHNFTCNSENVIYLITCTKCRKQYVGMTTQKLSTRLNHHRTNIFTKRRTYLHSHFNLPDHTIKNLTIQAIDKVNTNPNDPSELRKLEKFWIKTLQTYQPIGLNVNMMS